MLPFFKKKQKESADPADSARLNDLVFSTIKPLLDASPDFGVITPLIQVNDDKHAFIALEIDPQHAGALEGLRQRIEDTVNDLNQITKVSAVLTAKQSTAQSAAPKTQSAPKPAHPAAPQAIKLPHVKHVILIASGKGGVGKSTVTANLARTMHDQGLRVGIMDADIYGPSQPTMMGVSGQKPDGSQGSITPLDANGIQIMSIGLMVDPNAALIWRGPIVQKALMQLCFDTKWGSADAPLDYLLIDMPPGTGDVQLTLVQKLHIDGAVIVSTPQDISLIDARRSIAMFEKTNTPILGLIENMSTHICSNCGHEEHIFGHGGARKEAEKLNVSFLGEIPLSANIRAQADSGNIKGNESFIAILKQLSEHDLTS